MQKELLEPFSLYYGRVCTFCILDLKKCSGLILLVIISTKLVHVFHWPRNQICFIVYDQKMRIHIFRSIILMMLILSKIRVMCNTLITFIFEDLLPIVIVEWFGIITKKKNDIQSHSKKCTLNLTQIIISSWFRWFEADLSSQETRWVMIEFNLALKIEWLFG